jgi:hypothetical protein
MVLRCDEAVLGVHHGARLVVAAVAVRQLVRLGAGREGEELGKRPPSAGAGKATDDLLNPAIKYMHGKW